MATEKNNNLFWISFSDLMTTLFFVMLVLFGIAYTIQSRQNQTLRAAKVELDEIHKIQDALNNLDANYFSFDERNKRYKLNIDVKFNGGSANIGDIQSDKQESLLKAGESLFKKMSDLAEQNPNVDYLLIVEGNAQRSDNNFIAIPDIGYKLSYERALSLVNLWQSKNWNFRDIPNCEILIAGSGYFGRSRDKEREWENRKFTIQITPKIGDSIKK